MINILIFALVIYLIVRHVKKKQGEQKKTNCIPNQDPRDYITNLDNDYFLIKNGYLLEYRGQSDSIVVPRGVQVIGGNDTKICSKTISHIYIPKTVHVISDLALPYVEHVHYEGSQENLLYDKQYNFFADGWIPDWSKPDPIQFRVRVNNVTFDYNDRHYEATAKAHYERTPDELKS